MGVNGIYGLVKVGMMSKQSEYDKMQQKFTKNEWTKQAYVDVYGKVQTFNNSTLSQYKMSANMNARSAESSSSEVKVTANASAPQMTHYVEVGKAATNAYLIGTNSLTRLGDSQTSTQLRDTFMTDVSKNGTGDTVYFKDANGVSQQASSKDVAFKFAVSDKSTGNLTSSDENVVTATASASAANASHTVNITETAQTASLTSTANVTRYNSVDSDRTKLANALFRSVADNGDGTYDITNNCNNNYTSVSGSKIAFAFTIGDGDNSADISVTVDQLLNGYSFSDLADEINGKNLNITASYDSSNDTFSLKSNAEGSDGTISLKVAGNSSNSMAAGNTTAALLRQMKLQDANGTVHNSSTDFAAGQANAFTTNGTDAQGTVDGTAVTFSGNTATVDGVTYTATGVGESTVKVEQNVVSVTYGQLADGYTFNDLTVAVNNLGTNVRATYDSVNDKFSFFNAESGKENAVSLIMADEDDGGAAATNFFNAIGLKQSANGELSDDALSFSSGTSSTVSGTNANVKVDGVDYDIADNKLTVNGVTYNFTGATEGTKSTVTVTQDTDKIIEKVKSFVEDYNKLLKDLTDMYNEKPNSNYKPLTDSQKDAMKDEQIEKWEEKAKAGLLYHDNTLGKLISEMRDAVSTPVDGVAGKYNNIFALGISTTGTKGQLTLDEDKLKAALADDADSVYNVFAKLDANDMDDSSKSGIAQRLGDVFTNNMKNIKSVSGTDLNTNDDSDLSKLLRELQTKMSNFKAMMNAFEDKLYKKYDAMETALAKLGTQLNYVSSSFS